MRATASVLLTFSFLVLCFSTAHTQIQSPLNLQDFNASLSDLKGNVEAFSRRQNAPLELKEAVLDSIFNSLMSIDDYTAFLQGLEVGSEGSQSFSSATGGGLEGIGQGIDEMTIPPSPNSMSMIDAINSEVNLYTGVLSNSINLYNLKSHDLSVNVGLNYNTSGIKVNTVPSWTGLGWSLSAGGSVTRIIKNMPDEMLHEVNTMYNRTYPAFGFLNLTHPDVDINGGVDLDNFFSGSYSYDEKKKIVQGQNWRSNNTLCEPGDDCPIALDLSPDEFYFQFGGYSGKFVFDQQGDIHIIPHQNLKLRKFIGEANGFDIITGFEVTTPEGVVYKFGEKDDYTFDGEDDLSTVEFSTITTTTLNNYYEYQYLQNIIAPDFSILNLYRRIPKLNIAQNGQYDTFAKNGNTQVSTNSYYPTTWHLKSIHSTSGDQIDFSYTESEEINYVIDRSYSSSMPNLSEFPNPDNCALCLPVVFISPVPPLVNDGDGVPRYPRLQTLTYSVSDISTKFKYLSSISTSNNYILDFTPEIDRVDLYKGKALNKITLEYNGQHVKSWKLDYDQYVKFSYDEDNGDYIGTREADIIDLDKGIVYDDASAIDSDISYLIMKAIFLGLTGDDEIDYANESNKILIAEHNRLYLESVTEVGKNEEEIEVANFEYYDKELPRRFSVKQDSYGYYSSNSVGTLIPYMKYTPVGGFPLIEAEYENGWTSVFPLIAWDNIVATGEDPEDEPIYEYANFGHQGAADEEKSKHGVLETINFITGGSRTFSYELNSFMDGNGNEVACCGLRVNGITASPNDDYSPANAKSYTYSNGYRADRKIKKYQDKPAKGGVEYWVDGSSYSIKPYLQTKNADIGYENVRIDESGSGSTEYTFFRPAPTILNSQNVDPYDSNSENEIPNKRPIITNVHPNNSIENISAYGYPYPGYTDFDWKRGLIRSEKIYNGEGALLVDRENIWNFDPEGFTPVSIPDFTTLFAYDHLLNDFSNELLRIGRHYHISDWYYLESTVENFYDENGQNPVEKITSYTYDSDHLNMVESSFVNSDGKIHKTKMYYPEDVQGSGSIADVSAVATMIDNHILNTPIVTENYVNNSIVGGQLLKFQDYTFGDHTMSLPFEYYMHYPGITWDKEGEVLSYQAFGYPQSIQKTNDVLTTSYMWNDVGLVEEKTYGDWVWSYSWDKGSRLITGTTDIDGQSIAYEYDDLYRLWKIFERGGIVSTEFEYGYRGQGFPDNYVRKEVDYGDTGTDDTEVNISRQISDGLGKSLFNNLLNYSPTNSDVIVNKTDYDAANRPINLYRQHGADGEGLGPKTAITYEDSPLDRIKLNSPSGPNYIEYEYLNNEGDVLCYTCPSGGNYPANSLFYTRVIDADGVARRTYKDLLGRVILERSEINDEYADTYYVYDDFGNVLGILPPEATSLFDDISFNYIYDIRHRLILKRVPGAEPVFFAYDGLDRPVLTQHGNMRESNASKWLATEYDDYHRVLKTGWYYGGITSNPTIFTSNILGYNTYGTSGIEINRIKETITSILDESNIVDADILLTEYNYDGFGRVRSLFSTNHLSGGQDIIAFAYDNADKLLGTRRVHNGYENISIVDENIYDHSGRLEFARNSINSGPQVILNKNKYNIRDELIEVNLHGKSTTSNQYLQSIDYAYNDGGWLTHINGLNNEDWNLPINSCEELPVLLPSDCGDFKVDLKELLRLRLSEKSLDVNCYDECFDYPILYTPTGDNNFIQESTGDQINMVLAGVDMEQIIYPTKLSRVVFYSGDEKLMLSEELELFKGTYTKAECVTIPHKEKLLTIIGEDGGTVQKTFSALMQERTTATPILISSESCKDTTSLDNNTDYCISDETYNAHSIHRSNIMALYNGDYLYESFIDVFEGSENSLEEDGLTWTLKALVNNENIKREAAWDVSHEFDNPLSTEVTSYTIEVKHESQCSLNTVVGLYDGNNFIRINGNQLFVQLNCSSSGNLLITPDVLLSADKIQRLKLVIYSEYLNNYGSDAHNIDVVKASISYKGPCNNCTEKNNFTASNAKFNQGKSYFSNRPANYSIVEEGIRANSYEEDGDSWFFKGIAEVEWDLPILDTLPTGVEITDYKVTIIGGTESGIPGSIAASKAVTFGLFNGTEFVAVNNGKTIYNYSAPGLIDEEFVLYLDEVPTIEEISNMKLRFRTSGAFDIDVVKVEVKLKVPCEDNPEPCVQVLPECTDLQQTQQMLTLGVILHQAEDLTVDDLVLPANLFRIRLCNGEERYLFEQELNSLPGNYLILHQISITSLDQVFDVDIDDALALDKLDLFSMRLHYENEVDDFDQALYGAPRRNGNIGNMQWQTRGREIQAYGFTYDDLNRLERARYLEYHPDGSVSFDDKYGVDNISYDKRGNIMSLRRNGLLTGCDSDQGVGYGLIDELTYGYGAGNQMTSISEMGDVLKGFKSLGGGAYTYDANGNMDEDPHKGMDEVSYNYLNLPHFVDMGAGNEIYFAYSAGGEKLKKETSRGKIVDYIGAIEYIGGQLNSIKHGNGRIVPSFSEETGTIGSFVYEYTLSDHLGNSRVSFSDLDDDGFLTIGSEESEVLQENHYYPFGMAMDGNWIPQVGVKNQYLYNGKELNEDFGLNWLDYGARWYDPAIGRWGQVDPLAEEYSSISPYAYVANNPIIFIDPDGRYIDLGGLSDKERGAYETRIKELRTNDLFNTYYTRLEKSETTYFIKSGQGAGGSGSFNPKTNEIHAIDDLAVFAQEAFHAYQQDLGVYDNKDLSVRETEGDLVSTSVANSLGKGSIGNGLWDQGIGFEYVDNDLNFDESVLTPSFDDAFNKAVDSRINLYKERERTSGAKAPGGYIQANSGVGALALKKAVRETGANNQNLVGPRLSNGDFYSN